MTKFSSVDPWIRPMSYVKIIFLQWLCVSPWWNRVAWSPWFGNEICHIPVQTPSCKLTPILHAGCLYSSTMETKHNQACFGGGIWLLTERCQQAGQKGRPFKSGGCIPCCWWWKWRPSNLWVYSLLLVMEVKAFKPMGVILVVGGGSEGLQICGCFPCCWWWKWRPSNLWVLSLLVVVCITGWGKLVDSNFHGGTFSQTVRLISLWWVLASQQ